MDEENVNHRDFGGSGDPMLLVHGLGGSIENWLPVAPLLTRVGRVVAIDLRGHGRTPMGDGETADVYSNRALIERFIDAHFDEPVTLVGNSMGGMISLLHAAERPDQVARLVLVDPSVPTPDGVPRDPVVDALFSTYVIPGTGEEFIRQATATYGPEAMTRRTIRLCCRDAGRVGEDVVQAHIDLAGERTSMPWAVDAFIQAARSLVDLKLRSGEYYDLIKSIRQPALIVQGAHDRLVPLGAAMAVADLRPDWQIVTFDDAGHMPQLEMPEGFVDVVLLWLAHQKRLEEVGRSA
ncbi:MAG: hypothetical protein QOH26_1527 [Actinomycetota bacterium]|nr:hypothetical protein [Actinomycetota bacterium]